MAEMWSAGPLQRRGGAAGLRGRLALQLEAIQLLHSSISVMLRSGGREDRWRQLESCQDDGLSD